MDIILKEIPEECEKEVKYMAMVAVERFLRKSLDVDAAKLLKFETDLDNIKTANNMQDEQVRPTEPN